MNDEQKTSEKDLSLYLLGIKKISIEANNNEFKELFLGKNSALNTNYYPLRQFYKHNSISIHKYIKQLKNGEEDFL